MRSVPADRHRAMRDVRDAQSAEGVERRLLVISYHFPPDGAVGGLRWAGLTKYLAALGWKTWVLTAAASVSGRPPEGVAIEFCPRGPTVSDLYQRYRRLLPGGRRPSGTGVERESELPKPASRDLASALRAECAGLLWLLDEGRGWTLRAAVRARDLIARVQPHVVVSTSPPHPIHLAAWFATRRRHIRWFADFRDPWTGPVSRAWRSHPLAPSRTGRAAVAQLERLVVDAATGIVATTREMAAALAERYPGVAVSWVPNGVDRDLLPPRSGEPFAGLAIAHVGTLYGGRDLGPALRAFRLFVDRHPNALHDGSRLRIAGHAEPELADSLHHEVAALDLGRHVDVLGVLPRDEALNLLARSRLVLVLAQDQDLQIPTKLYESVAMELPTLVVAASGSAARREAQELGATVVDPSDVAAMVRVFERIWSNQERSADRPQVPIDYRDLAASVSSLLAGEGDAPTKC